MSAVLRVCALYPELMNIYADRGQHRGAAGALRMARDRVRAGLGLAAASRSTRTPTTSSTWAAARTATRWPWPRTWPDTKRDALHAAADRGAVVLAVCGGYQLLGHSYQLGERGAARAWAWWTCARCASPGRG